jgi:hypothetical protein
MKISLSQIKTSVKSLAKRVEHIESKLSLIEEK